MLISLDIETYGAAKANNIGVLLPPQSVFHPEKSLYIDGVAPDDLILTVSITFPKIVWSQPISTPLNFDSLAGLVPGTTMVFELHKEEHRRILRAYLLRATVILGMNLQFDLQYLRRLDYYINYEAKLVDLSVINYLHSELREERSLKALGPVLGTFSYKDTLKTKRFKRSTDVGLLSYNAQDTHNTILAIAELSRRLLEDKFETHYDDKHGEYCLSFYSESIWATIAMSEAGVPMSSVRLYDMLGKAEVSCDESICAAKEHGLILQGEGSAISKDKFMLEVVTLIETTTDPDIMDKLDVTPKSKRISFNKKNRNTLLQQLVHNEDTDIYFKLIENANDHSESMKLISSYCYPLLYHRRNKHQDMSSILIPINGKPLPPFSTTTITFDTPSERVDAAAAPVINVRTRNSARFNPDRHPNQADAITYPTWYVTPSNIKNDIGSSGGTVQGRITCKQPGAQTFPSSIKACIRSRFPKGRIVAMDLSQAELRVAALLSGDKTMVDAYQNDRDLHEERAKQLWGDDFNTYCRETYTQRRQVAKMMNFADLFLSSANTMKEQVYAQSNGEMDLEIEFYQKVVRERINVRPQLTAWQNSMLRIAKRDNRITLPFTGQSRTFFGDLGALRSEIVNFPIQTTAGNVTLAIQHEINKRISGKTTYKKHSDSKPVMFLQIYDAIYIDSPEDYVSVVENVVNESKEEVENSGYWSLLQDIYRVRVPLKHDMELLG